MAENRRGEHALLAAAAHPRAKRGRNREKAWSMLQGNTKKGKKQKPLQQGLLTENLAPPAGFEPVACRLGEQIIALCMVRLVRWDVPNSLIYRGFCRMTLSCRDAQYHVFHSFSQRPISKILAKAKSRLSKNVPRWVSLCKLIITNPTLKNQGSDLFIG